MASLESGKRLADRYVLEERLGDGGHAEVWAARDEPTRQRVALKFLHLQSCTAEDAWHVLQHEAQMAQRLDHPGVLRVQPPDRDGEVVFLPMEYASGGDVRALRGAPWRQVLPVLLQVATVLEHAHSRGVVHRDVKPGNVLFDGAGAVRVTDFGTAARTGSTAALADGSPFSASPQQLRGEAATTADDVYGLGALAYELLSRYPPHYPDFDARRVQREMPAALLPVHPAPPALLAFIMAMLERDPQLRPDLGEVIRQFSASLATSAAADSGAALLVDESAPRSVDAPPRKRRPLALLGLAAAALTAAALFIWLPVKSVPQPSVPEIAAEAPPVISAPEKAGVPPATEPVPEKSPEEDPLQPDIAAGDAALKAHQPALARAAFQRALLHDASNAAALAGVAASDAQQHVLDSYSAAMRTEAAGDLARAAAQYETILKQDAAFEPARVALVRVHGAQQALALEAALAEGAQALASARVDAAEKAYARAKALNDREPRVLEGLARVAEIRRSELNLHDLTTGAGLERDERWSDAVTHYRSVLARDAQLRFADDGLTRSTRRAELDAELRDYLDRPERLTAAAVRLAAERALARGEATAPQGARLSGQLQQLRARLAVLNVPAHVQIMSDNSTQISLPAVGELGIFMQHELELPPGQYTVIGRREGFRDVRRELNITPGQQRVALTVQCTERI